MAESDFVFQHFVKSTRSPLGVENIKWAKSIVAAYKGLKPTGANINSKHVLEAIGDHVDWDCGELIEFPSLPWLQELILNQLNFTLDPEAVTLTVPHLCVGLFHTEDEEDTSDQLIFGMVGKGDNEEYIPLGTRVGGNIHIQNRSDITEVVVFDTDCIVIVDLEHIVGLVNSGITGNCNQCGAIAYCPLFTIGKIREGMREVQNGELESMTEEKLLELFGDERFRERVRDLIKVVDIRFLEKDETILGPKEIRIVKTVADLMSRRKEVNIDTVFNSIPASDKERPSHRWIEDVLTQRMPCLQSGKCHTNCRYHQIDGGCPVCKLFEP